MKTEAFSHIRGFNYQPGYGSHGLEIWGEKFDASRIEKELGLGKKYFPKINTIRLWLSHDAFLKSPERLCDNFEEVLKIGENLGLSFIPVLFNGWHSFPDFGGISTEQISYWGKGERFNNLFLPYLEGIVLPHIDDQRILLWDLCNEPFNSTANSSEARDIIFNWLQIIYQISKNFDSKCKISVGSIPSMESVKILEPISDVITIHPYYAWNAWIKEGAFKDFLDDAVNFANKVNKPLLATETGWGSLDDKQRSETLAFELGELRTRRIGWLVHLLHHSLVADAHRPEFGPISEAGYMAFIEADGSLRAHHEILNQY